MDGETLAGDRPALLALLAVVIHRGGPEAPRPSRALRLLCLDLADAWLADAEEYTNGRVDLSKVLRELAAAKPAASLAQLEAALLQQMDALDARGGSKGKGRAAAGT